MRFLYSRCGFSLIEAIVGITIIAAIAVVSYLGAGTCFRADLHNSDKTLAVHLIQKSQEEIRRAAQTYYDKLNTCDFVADNTCGLSEGLPAGFERFNRIVSIRDEGSTELKRIEIQAQWTDILGNAHTMPSVMFMSRPPEPLPGNIIGVVTNAVNGNLLANVFIQITNGIMTHAVTSSGSLTAKNVNYDFTQNTGGVFNIDSRSNWDLTATLDGFHETTINGISLASNEERRVDFKLQPKPESRQIIARLRNTKDGSYISFPSNSSWIYLWEDGKWQHRVRRAGQLTWTVEFEDTDSRYFTVNTDQSFYSKYVGNFACDARFRYYYDGWSSAVVRDDGPSEPHALNCAVSWNGSANVGDDRIEVRPGPGDPVNVDVWVHPVPVCRVWGYVRDQNKNPISNGWVYGYWHNGSYINRVSTRSDGSYEIYLPAEQEIEPFENQISYHPQVRGRASRQIVRCCDQDSWQNVYSPFYRVNHDGTPVLEGGDYRVDIDIDLTPQIQPCGNAGGQVLDIQGGGGLGGARAYLGGNSRLTNGSGNYIFDCGMPAPPYCLPQGSYTYAADLNKYYPFDSNDSPWYTDRPSADIQRDTSNLVPDIEMLSLCRESITVEINDSSTGNPILNADLTLTAHNDSGSTINLTGQTNSSGQYTFSNVIETWPTPYTLDHSNFQQTVRQHSLTVESSEFYDPLTIAPIELICGVPGLIQGTLTPKDQM